MRANASVQAFIYSLKVYLLNSYSAPEIMRTNICKIKYLKKDHSIWEDIQVNAVPMQYNEYYN